MTKDYTWARVDEKTMALYTIDYAHKEIHGCCKFYCQYSVPSLGAMTTPNDMITLTFTTPNTTKWAHFEFIARGSSGWRARFIEAPTGGGESPTGSLSIFNQDRNADNDSTISDVAASPVVAKASYDATLVTGGTALWDDYIEGSTVGQTGWGITGVRDERILRQNTTYQLSIYGTDTTAASLFMTWYEHTNKG